MFSSTLISQLVCLVQKGSLFVRSQNQIRTTLQILFY